MIVRSFLTIGALALALGVAACDRQAKGGDSGTKGANAGDADPALTGALQDQIMVDPDLAQQSNDHSALPAATTRQAPIPRDTAAGDGRGGDGPKGALRAPSPKAAAATGDATLGQLAKAQASGGCVRDVRYSAAWAGRMPASMPLYPDARVTEAAGNDLPGCRLRAVSFTSAAPMQRLIDWYYTVAIRGGYSSEHQAADGEHILAGTRAKDDAAYYILIRGRPGGGAEVDLIATNGR